MVADKFGRVDHNSLHTTMSIDKFGRHGLSTSTTVGKPPIGYTLTDDGRLDMEGKIIHNVGDPKSTTDVVTKRYLDSHTITTGVNTNFDAGRKLIRNVLQPLLPGDVVNKDYVDKYFLQKHMNSHYDAGQKRIINLRDPMDNSDATTKTYVKNTIQTTCMIKNAQGNFDAQDKTITNIGRPSNPKDATTKQYVDESALTVDGEWINNSYNAKDKQIRYVKDPTADKDVVTKGYLKRRYLRRNQMVVPFGDVITAWNAQDLVLGRLKEPTTLTDAVNVQFLKKVLGDVVYWIYSKFASTNDKIWTISKEDWILEQNDNYFGNLPSELNFKTE